MLLRCVIIDDDKIFTKILERYIFKIDFMELSHTYSDAYSAAASLDLNNVDLLFRDIEMLGMSGIEFLKSLPVVPPVIIVSQKKEYGADVFDHDSIDYLHKPVSFPRFIKAAHKAQRFFEQTTKSLRNKKDSLFVRQEKMWVRILTRDILYIKADDNDVIIQVPDKTYKSHTKLTDIYSQLPQKDFLQVHRSYIVQLHKIDRINGDFIEINNATISVSKAHLKELRASLNIL